jgi:CMP-N-acetylneuraminic acid synthetase
MRPEPFTIAHIPARSGSTRLPDKNILELHGHPLLAYTVRMALLMDEIDLVVVNTDSERYAEVAREYGAEVPFLRDSEFAQTNSCIQGAWMNFKDKFESECGKIDRVVHMLPTSPFRNYNTVNKIIELFKSYFKISTVYRTSAEPENVYIEAGGQMKNLQEMSWYKFNPEYYWIKPISYISCTWEYVNDNPLCRYNNFGYYFINNFIEAVDIDTREDFESAQEIVANNLYDFGVNLWQQ